MILNWYYWDKNTEIDIVATNNENNTILFGECKWTNQKVGVDVLNNLISKTGFVNWGFKDERKENYIIFSKNGFKKKLLEIAEKDKTIILIDFSVLKTTSNEPPS